MSLIAAAPPALHRGEDQVPFVAIGDGSFFRVLLVDATNGLWIIENRFAAGYRVQTHRHTGPVFAYTTSGAWKYEEQTEINRAGSFLLEPAGSVHTLTVIEDQTRVWFQMYGVNLNLDASGNVESVSDGPGSLAGYRLMCEAAGHGAPEVIEL
ncbi:2,4'-dihydroxyacetophenone dioxygenase family protein [Pseudofrankia inefficax]|uniref:ChrR-like cupin domain-containing protein n=1 Tax=Pseudofrankia inefficax (strain DSM 45817 / CECT 9037 / DDB 130130 / EuI1c) TaxID=298654 RepID=E3IWG8_PSEI1|nr:2,4'-dihydroxyacetophenone dioxygenase family protein [Pseudofrankia inefficax]ADP80151.1 hypothetical protein FraEuI1c_2103 [Pseudofrankia inefficax]